MDASNQISDEGLEPSISDSSLYLYEYEWNEVERKELRKKFWVPDGIWTHDLPYSSRML